jgi:hypothetical protein
MGYKQPCPRHAHIDIHIRGHTTRLAKLVEG